MRELDIVGVHMPEIGDVLDSFGDTLVVTATFCVVNNLSFYPSFVGVSPDALDDYFAIMKKFKMEGGLGFTKTIYEPAREVTDRDPSKTLILYPLSVGEQPGAVIGYNLFDLPKNQKEAMRGDYNLLTVIEGVDSRYVLDGHYLEGTKEKPIVMTTLYNQKSAPYPYMNIRLEKLMAARPNGFGPTPKVGLAQPGR